MKDLHELATNNGLQVRKTVEGNNNGYPKGFKDIIVGFSCWEDVIDFISENGGKAITLHHRAGWHNYERCDEVTEPMYITAEMYGEDYNILTKDSFATEEEYLNVFVKPQLNEYAKTIEDVIQITQDASRIWDSIESMKFRNSMTAEGVVIMHNALGWFEYDTIDIECVEWSHDGHNYEIGVILD